MKFLPSFSYMTLVALSLGCGSGGGSPDDESEFIASGYNMDLFNLFTCERNITETSSLYTPLGLDSDLKIIYTVFYGTRVSVSEKIVKVQIDKESGVATSAFDTNKSVYLQDTLTTSAISLAADVNSDGGDGVWTFSVVSDVATMTYTDSDLAEAVTDTFLITEDSSTECRGPVKNDPTS